MSLMDTLMPASPPEPTEARVVRLLGLDPVGNDDEKLARNRLWYSRHKEAQAAAARERYRRRNADRSAKDGE